MAHIKKLDRVEFNSIARTVTNLSPAIINVGVYDETGATPMNGLIAPVTGPIHNAVSFTTQMNPSGSAAGAKTPPDALLFKACGWKETISTTVSTTYSIDGLLPTNQTLLDLTAYLGNAYKIPIDDAVGDLVIRLDPSTVPLCDWSLFGLYTTPTEAAGTATLTNGGKAPKCIGTITWNTKTLVMKRATIRCNNGSSAPNFDMAASASNGVSAADLSDQVPTIELLVQVPAFSTENLITDVTSNTALALSAAFGTGAGYVITITGKFYMTTGPTYEYVNGVLCARINGRMGTASGEPLAIAFT